MFLSGKLNFKLKYFGKTHDNTWEYHEHIERAFENSKPPRCRAFNLIFCLNCHKEEASDLLQQEDPHKKIIAIFKYDNLLRVTGIMHKRLSVNQQDEYYKHLMALIRQIPDPDMHFFDDYYFGKPITIIDNIKIKFYIPTIN